MSLAKIISGGQTGVDRAALDVALRHQLDCGGWCPSGRLDENGRIPDRYPVTELPNGGFAERTAANVRDSDATVVFHAGELRGGSEYTLQCCAEQKRPRLAIDAGLITPREAAQVIRYLIESQKVHTLNVAGPRHSEWRKGYDYAFAALEHLLQTAR
jgi:Circularly permutated YpsA SLOG family